MVDKKKHRHIYTSLNRFVRLIVSYFIGIFSNLLICPSTIFELS